MRKQSKKQSNTPAARQARSRENRTKEGGRMVSVFVEAPAAAKLDSWAENGYGPTETINRVLRSSRVPPPKKQED